MDSAHLVQFHKKSEYLSESVADFIRQGLTKGDGICVFATRYHWQLLKPSLLQEDAGSDPFVADERLMFIDAHTVLSEISRNGRPDKVAFADFIGGIIQRMQKSYPNLKEIGLDIAIDKSWNIWILEVNTKPALFPFKKFFKDPSIYKQVEKYANAYGRNLSSKKKTKKTG